MHVDMKLFNCHDYSLAWLLVIPAWNWIKGTVSKIKSRAAGGEQGERGIGSRHDANLTDPLSCASPLHLSFSVNLSRLIVVAGEEEIVEDDEAEGEDEEDGMQYA